MLYYKVDGSSVLKQENCLRAIREWLLLSSGVERFGTLYRYSVV